MSEIVCSKISRVSGNRRRRGVEILFYVLVPKQFQAYINIHAIYFKRCYVGKKQKLHSIYNILALSLARSCAACVSIHIAARLQNPKVSFPLTNTTGLIKKNSLSYIYIYIYIHIYIHIYANNSSFAQYATATTATTTTTTQRQRVPAPPPMAAPTGMDKPKVKSAGSTPMAPPTTVPASGSQSISLMVGKNEKQPWYLNGVGLHGTYHIVVCGCRHLTYLKIDMHI